MVLDFQVARLDCEIKILPLNYYREYFITTFNHFGYFNSHLDSVLGKEKSNLNPSAIMSTDFFVSSFQTHSVPIFY